MQLCTMQVIVENIYETRENGEIRFVALDAAGAEMDEEVVNVLLKNPMRVEYFKRTVSTKERVPFLAPKQGAVHAIGTTTAIAQGNAPLPLGT